MTQSPSFISPSACTRLASILLLLSLSFMHLSCGTGMQRHTTDNDSTGVGNDVAAVSGQSDTIALMTTVYHDSCEAGSVSFRYQLPKATNDATRCMADTLIGIINATLGHFYGDDSSTIPPYRGPRNDSLMVRFYASHILKYFTQTSLSMKSSQDDGEGMTDEDYTRPELAYDSKLVKIRETPLYIVFLSEDYGYMGGAHGGILGAGNITFRKSDGKHITHFFNCDAKALQGLLRKGLISYFNGDGDGGVTDADLNDQLTLEDTLIPLPVTQPLLSENGLVLTYMQYEIACYAAGMPSFCIPYEDILPFLTPEVKALLGPMREKRRSGDASSVISE